MNPITSLADIQQHMAACYTERTADPEYCPEESIHVRILRKAQDRFDTPVLETALRMIRLAQSDPGGLSFAGEDEATQGFCAAAYYLLEVEPKELEEY